MPRLKLMRLDTRDNSRIQIGWMDALTTSLEACTETDKSYLGAMVEDTFVRSSERMELTDWDPEANKATFYYYAEYVK